MPEVIFFFFKSAKIGFSFAWQISSFYDLRETRGMTFQDKMFA